MQYSARKVYEKKAYESSEPEDTIGDTDYCEDSRNQKSSNLNFLSLLCNEVPFDYKLKKYKVRKSPIEAISFEIDDSHRFRNTVSITKTGSSTIQSLSNSSRNSTVRDFIKKKQLDTDIQQQYEKNFSFPDQVPQIVPVDVVEWENSVFLDDVEDISVKEYVDGLLNSEWDRNIFEDPSEMPVSKNNITLFIEDPNLIFEKIEEKKTKLKKKILKFSVSEKPLKNKYNISNDKYYQNEVKSKASLGTFGVQHSLPALKLDPRFYKTNHSKEELRSFHRPPVCIKNTEYVFKAVPKSKFVGNIIKKGHELTLKDSTSLAVFEYSEEFPFYVVNPGMVSLMNTYYRKTDVSDEPPSDSFIALEPEDEAPFFGFGTISPGSHLMTLTNNLFIAPVFKHSNHDFLCIVDENEIAVRPLDTVFLVGQEFPKEEVFAPHSRKLNQFCKDRLKVAAYRIFSKGRDLLMQQLDQMFPYFSEGSKRKWLKEYSDCIKKGRENVWVLKDSFSIIGEEDLRKMVTPENICQYESMLSAERRMQDLGYKCLETEDEDQEYDFFAPSWYLSRNFVNAANGRGLLELSGSNDPSDSEAFSFRKIKLRKGNESENRKIIAEQQASYKERIDDIWNRQIAALSQEYPPEYQPSASRPTFESQSETTGNETKCLIIKRVYEENDKLVDKITKIYDEKVIKAYLKARKRVKPEEKRSMLTCSSCGQSGHMKTNKSCPNFVGSSKSMKKKAEERKKPAVLFQEKLLKLISSFMAIPFSNAFHRPVSLKKFPSYKNIIKTPMDLGTVKSKIKDSMYTHYYEFLNDLILIKDNCATYNGPSHSLTEIAENICHQATQYYELNNDEITELENNLKRDSELPG